MKRYIKPALLVIIAILLGILGAWVIKIAETQQDSAADRADLREQLTDQQAASELLAEQVRSLGGEPVVEPTTPGVPTTTPEARYMPVPGRDGKDGSPGRDGADGESITGSPGRDGESIVGPRGRDGQSIAGPPGADGASITGPSGPAGPAGKDGRDGADSTVPGPPGAEGPAGRGIEALACVGPRITFTITWTDGTTSEVQCGR